MSIVLFFGDRFHALRACITLLHEGTFNDADCTLGTVLSPEFNMGYDAIIQPAYNNMLDSHTIYFNVDIIDPSVTWYVTSLHMCVMAVHVSNQNSSISGSLVLHPDFPAAEPCVLSHHSSFGGRFCIAFRDSNCNWYAHPCSTLELLLAYSIAKTLLSNPAIWLSYNFLIYQLLPGCLPICLASTSARSPIHMNRIYDELLCDNNEHLISAQCFILTPTPLSLFNWSVAYT